MVSGIIAASPTWRHSFTATGTNIWDVLYSSRIVNLYHRIMSDKTLNFHYPISRFNDIVNILRYEKPLYLLMITHSWSGGLVTDELEPVGEQEK